jgi:hypothetical protein
MKNLKSVKVVKSTIDKMFASTANVSEEDFDEVLSINPEHRAKIEKIKPLFNVSTVIDPEEIEVDDDEAEDGDTSPSEAAIPKSEIKSTKGWLDYKPDLEWRQDHGSFSNRFKKGLMVSEEGDVWDILHDKLLEKKFLDCEVKVVIGKDCYEHPEVADKTIRVAPIVCRLWNINSNTKGTTSASRVVIDYIDGDRRNLKPSNLKWVVQKAYPDRTKLLAEDVCRRLLDFNGDVEKTLEQYVGDPSITSAYVSNIRFKLIQTSLSDKFFKVDKTGGFYPIDQSVSNKKTKTTTQNKTSEKTEVKKADPEITVVSDDILDDHIRAKKLSDGEKNFILLKVINTLKEEKGKITPEIVVDIVRDQYNVMLPTSMAATMIGGSLV